MFLLVLQSALASTYNPLAQAQRERFITGIATNRTVILDRASFVQPAQKNIIIVPQKKQVPLLHTVATQASTSAGDIYTPRQRISTSVMSPKAKVMTQRERLQMEHNMMVVRMQRHR